MLDDMMDALTYLDDLDEATRLSYRDNNYCVAGYAYGITLVQALERYNEHEGEYGELERLYQGHGAGALPLRRGGV